MAEFVQFDPAKQPRCKVELHAHLDGAVRLTTIWELAQKKGIDLKVKTLEDLIDVCSIKRPCSLAEFLRPFSIFTPVIVGDAEAVERIAYEFCEDAVRQGTIYSEARYCPHLFTSPENPSFTPRDVVKCVQNGLNKGAKDFNVTIRGILCCFRSRPEWSKEIVQLCLDFKDRGVVGIDVAGDEALTLAEPETVAAFKIAIKEGIHRTAHAGEAGPAGNVRIATTEMQAERIGHGYHVVDDKEIYAECRKAKVHFEVCPYSSCLTGSVSLANAKHPIVQFAEDGVNFSISRDDPTLIRKCLDEEYQFLRDLGLKDVHFARANFNAVRSCFLPEDQKQQLLEQLVSIYGAIMQGDKEPKIKNIPV